MAQTLGSVAVGSIVKLNEGGSPVEFYVAKQDYEPDLNGAGRTLVVRKDCYDNKVWDTGNVNAYASSDLDSWVNSTYKNMLDADIRSLIGTTKIRYTPGNGNWTVGTLERAIFALSLTELGESYIYANTEGSALPIASTLQVAHLNGSTNTQWTRSPYTNNTDHAVILNSNGNVRNGYCNYSNGSRPAFTLPGASSYVDDNNNVITNPPPTAPGTLTVPDQADKGGSVAISWSASTDPNGNLSGYTLQRSANGGGFTQVYQGASTSYTDTAPTNADTLQYRVQAYDTQGATSGWTTSDQFPVYGVPTLTVPQMVMQGQSATISWTAISGADSYTLERKSSADADWTQVYSGANLSYTETVGTWTSLQYRVQAVFDDTPGGWATSDSIQIVAASALVISGTDGDLGTLTSDVQYSISSDQTGNTISVSVEVNGGEYAEFTATSGQTYSVGVLDLPTGTGSIVITATTTVSSSPVTVTRSWTYTKTAVSFPAAGSVERLTQEGAVVWPETLAEAVRAGTPWGGNLSTALELLKKAALYNRTQTPKYNEVNINLATATVGQIINLPVNGVMTPHRVVHIGNPDAELYDASCDGVWMWRQDTDESGAWSTTNSNVLPNSAIMQAMAGLLDNYDSTIQGAIKTVKIPYGVGGDSSAVNSGANGLECKIFPLGGYEVGFTDEGTTFIPEDGAKLAYFEAGLGTSANSKRIAKLNGSNYNYWLRSSYYGGTGDYGVASYSVSATGARGPNNVSATMAYCNAFILPTTFTATYYVDQAGTTHDSQEYTEAGDWLDVWGNAIPAVRIETGSYTGTGTYGQSNPNTLTFSFVPKILIVSTARNISSGNIAGFASGYNAFGWENGFMWIDGEKHVPTSISSASQGTYIVVTQSENTISWYAYTMGASYQANSSNIVYTYIALG